MPCNLVKANNYTQTNTDLTVDTMTLLKTRVLVIRKGKRAACGHEMKLFKLHELWTSSRNDCYLFQLCVMEKTAKTTKITQLNMAASLL